MDFDFRASTIHSSNHFPSLQASRLHSGTSFNTHFHFLLLSTAFPSLCLLYMVSLFIFHLGVKMKSKGVSFPWWGAREKKEEKEGIWVALELH